MADETSVNRALPPERKRRAVRGRTAIRGLISVCLTIAAVASLMMWSGRNHTGAVVAAASSEASAFTAMTPQRLVDTRIGLGVPKQVVAAGTALHVQVARRLGIPANATAVVANVIAVNADRPGFLQLLPTGQASFGSSSTLNTDRSGQTIPNASFAPLGDDGQLSVYVSFTTDVVIDVSGYFTPAESSRSGRLVPLTPTRILDSRTGLGWAPHMGTTAETGSSPAAVSNTEAVNGGTIATIQVAGRRGVPSSGASAVLLNMVAVDPAGPGFVQVAPTPVVPGASSNLNTSPGQTIANLVVVPLGSSGSVDVFVTTDVDLVADVLGYFTDATAASSSRGLFVPIAPSRQLDSREPLPRDALPEGSVTDIDVSDISTAAIAVAGNLTATEVAQPGFLQLAAPPLSLGASSSLNVTYAGQTIANAVVSPVASGQLQLHNLRRTHALLDVTGWFTPEAPPVATTTTTTAPAPDLQATPPTLNFQFADLQPFEPVRRTVVIHNDGDAPTGPIDVVLDPLDENTSVSNMFPKFDVIGDACSGGLAPGGSCTVTVELDIPLGTKGYGKLYTWKLSYGPDLVVPLTSSTDGPLLEHNGNEDFRSDNPDFMFDSTTTSHTLLVRNIGGATSGPISVPLPPAPFAVSTDTCNGQALDVGEVCSVVIDWTPPDSGEFFGMVVSGAPLSWQYKLPVELYAD